MVLGGVHDMTLPDSLYFQLGKLLLDVCSVVGGRVCLAKRGVDTVNAYAIRIWLSVATSFSACDMPTLARRGLVQLWFASAPDKGGGRTASVCR